MICLWFVLGASNASSSNNQIISGMRKHRSLTDSSSPARQITGNVWGGWGAAASAVRPRWHPGAIGGLWRTMGVSGRSEPRRGPSAGTTTPHHELLWKPDPPRQRTRRLTRPCLPFSAWRGTEKPWNNRIPLDQCFPTAVPQDISVPWEIIRCAVENAQFYIIGSKTIYSTQIMCLCTSYAGSTQWQAKHLNALPLDSSR